MIDLAIVDACYRATRYGDNEPLKELIKSGKADILDDALARELIIKFIDNEKILTRGKKFKSESKEEKDRIIVSYLCLLKGYGIPVKCTKRGSTKDGADILSEIFHKSHSTIIGVWRKRKNFISCELAKETGRLYKENGVKLVDIIAKIHI